jgi:hypothetical protein
MCILSEECADALLKFRGPPRTRSSNHEADAALSLTAEPTQQPCLVLVTEITPLGRNAHKFWS